MVSQSGSVNRTLLPLVAVDILHTPSTNHHHPFFLKWGGGRVQANPNQPHKGELQPDVPASGERLHAATIIHMPRTSFPERRSNLRMEAVSFEPEFFCRAWLPLHGVDYTVGGPRWIDRMHGLLSYRDRSLIDNPSFLRIHPENRICM